MKSKTPLHLKRLKIYTFIFLCGNFILNTFLLSMLMIIDNNYWYNTYGTVMGYLYVSFATFFVIIGFMLCKRLDEYFTDYY